MIVSKENDDIRQIIDLFIYLFKGIGSYSILNKHVFTDFEDCGKYYRDTSIQDLNIINILDVDSVNYIMEGTFEFEGSNSDCGDTVRVTDGYFKVKYQ
jgi:hypothetical protein